MTGQLLTVVAGYLSLVALLALLAAAGVPCAPAVRAGLVVAEVLLVGQALLDVASLLGGHRPDELATHLGYLAASVVLLPLLVGRPWRAVGAAPSGPVAPAGSVAPEGSVAPSGPVAPDGSRIEFVVAALAVAVSVVVSVRLHATWHG